MRHSLLAGLSKTPSSWRRMYFYIHLQKLTSNMQNGAEMRACAQAGAVIHLLSLFNTLFRSQYSYLGCSVHLWTVGFSWMPYLWKLMVPFDTALAKLFSHSDNLHFWLVLENLFGNLVINPERSYMMGQNVLQVSGQELATEIPSFWACESSE